MTAWLISLLVNNHFGVLTRVTGLFSWRGYNIVSLSVGETSDPAYSRITIQTMADGAGVNQIMKQLRKLEDVRNVLLLPGAETVVRELLLVKLIVPFPRREPLREELAGFNYQMPYEDEGRMILSLTGTGEECTAFLEVLAAYTIVELCRTGITAMSTTSHLSVEE